MTETPDRVDIHVGGRLRALRKSRETSQGDLGAALGITFQQIQKYERAANRISASMLFKAATFLQAPVSYFFDGLDEPDLLPVPDALEISFPQSKLIGSLRPEVRKSLGVLIEAAL